MKKLIALLLLTVTAFFAVSCGSDYGLDVGKNERAYHVNGLYFKLPKDFEEKHPYEESHIQKYYSNGDAGFFFNAFTGQMLEEQHGVSADISVEQYTRNFIIWNALEMDYVYDAERDRATLNYVYTYEGEDRDSEKYIYLILRGSMHLYVITMFCDMGVYSEYEELFDELVDVIYAD